MSVQQIKCLFSKQVTHSLGYLEYLPEGYSPKGDPWPLILFLHGAGERGDDLDLLKMYGPTKILDEGGDLPFVVISPQCPAGSWWINRIESLNALLDDAIEKYNVDEERIYLTGMSMGGFGAWFLATEHPGRFAALAPICGGGSRYRAERLKAIPVWVFHGAMDKTVPLSKSEEMVEALRKAGGDVKFTVYPEAGHDSWTETFANPDLYKWFLKHRRR